MFSTLTTEGLRHRNRAIVLNTLREVGPSSHTIIGERTGLASGTVSVITGEFLEEGIVEKVEQAPSSGRGRPRISFAPRAGFAQLILGRILVDRVEYSLIDYSGTLKDRLIRPRDPDQQRADAFGQELAHDLQQFIGRSKLEFKDVQSVSFTTKALVNRADTSQVWSPIFGDHELNLSQIGEKEWGIETRVSNETALAAHQVLMTRARTGKAAIGDRHAVLSLTDSVALGVARVSQMGDIETSAPSFGHISHDANGPMCRCGRRGCLETAAGFYGVLREALDGPVDNVPARFVPIEQISNIANLARSGDRRAVYAFRQAGTALGMALSHLFNLMGPMPVTITGAGLGFFDLMEEALLSQLKGAFPMSGDRQLRLDFLEREGEAAFASHSFLALNRFDQARVATRKY